MFAALGKALSTEQAGERIGVSRQTIYTLIKHPDPAERLKAHLVSGSFKIYEADLMAYIEKHVVTPDSEEMTS